MTQGNIASENTSPGTKVEASAPENAGTMFDPSLLSAAGILPSSQSDSPRAGLVGRLRSRVFWFRTFSYIAVAIVSFFVFLYLTFPYAVVKEGLVGLTSDSLRNAGIDARVNIGALKPYWFTGISLENVTITSTRDSAAQTRLGVVKARLQILPLFIGRASLSLFVTQTGGSLEVNASVPIAKAIAGSPGFQADLAFRNFPIDSFVAQALALAKSSTVPAMALIQPMLAVTSAGGMLDGTISAESADLNNPDSLRGKIALKIKGMFLHINDNVLQIPRQEFSTARIDASLDKGAVQLKETTAFVAPDVDIAANGRVGTGGPNGAAEVSLNLKLAMRGRVEANLANVIPMLLKCNSQPLKTKALENNSKESLLEGRLVGPIYAMNCEQSAP